MAESNPDTDTPPPAKQARDSASKDERLCLICGDRANGVHYNVLSCEGCKSFFLRSTKSKATFKCSQGGKCSMDLYTRRHCPACRMERCVELGMSVDRVWDDSRLKTRKRLVRVKRKKKQPTPNPRPVPTSSCIASPPPSSTVMPPAATCNPPAPASFTQTAIPNGTPGIPPEMPPGTTPDASPAMIPYQYISSIMTDSILPEMDLTADLQPLTPATNELQWELTEEQKSLLERLEKGYTASKEVFKNIFPKAPGSLPIPDRALITGKMNYWPTSAPMDILTAAAATAVAGSTMVETAAAAAATAATTTAAAAEAATAAATAAERVASEATSVASSFPTNSLNAFSNLTSLLPEGMTPAMALNALATGDLTIPDGFNLNSLIPVGLSLCTVTDESTSTGSNFFKPDPEETKIGSPSLSDSETKEAGAYQSIQRVTSFITNGSMKEHTPMDKAPKLPIHKELLHTAMDMFAILVKQTIHFAKTIPGFMDLLCDDQAVLIKASIMDALLLRCAESYVPDMGCVINEMTNDLFHINMMYQMGYRTLPEQAFQFMKETQECQLTSAEYALLNAVAILSPDRTELHNRELVEEIQLSMVETLHAATKVFHQEDQTLFAKLIMKLTKMRDIAVVHLSDLMEVQVQERDLSPLIIELFGLETTSSSS